MKKNKFILLLFLLYAMPCALYAEEASPVKAEAVFDKAGITIGEKVKYVVTLDIPKDTKIDFPEIDPVLTGTGFTIRDFGEEKPVKVSKNIVRIKRWYLLDTYVVGSYNVPAITINYTLPNGDRGSVQTKDAFLEVKSVIKEGEKTEDIKDIKQPVEIKVSYKKIIIRSIAVILLILAIAAGILFYVRYKRAGGFHAPEIPPHVKALQELEAIKNLDLKTEEMVKKYYIGVSGIVRHYIENRFTLHAPERTTEEFLNELTGQDILNREHKGLLRDFLRHCDMVKFAKYGPTKEEIEGVYIAAKRFIEETIPKTTDNAK